MKSNIIVFPATAVILCSVIFALTPVPWLLAALTRSMIPESSPYNNYPALSLAFSAVIGIVLAAYICFNFFRPEKQTLEQLA